MSSSWPIIFQDSCWNGVSLYTELPRYLHSLPAAGIIAPKLNMRQDYRGWPCIERKNVPNSFHAPSHPTRNTLPLFFPSHPACSSCPVLHLPFYPLPWSLLPTPIPFLPSLPTFSPPHSLSSLLMLFGRAPGRRALRDLHDMLLFGRERMIVEVQTVFVMLQYAPHHHCVLFTMILN